MPAAPREIKLMAAKLRELGQRVYNTREVPAAASRVATELGLDPRSGRDWVKKLVAERYLTEVVLTSETYGSKTFYTLGKPSDFEIATKLYPGAYLCHGTAAYLRDLTLQIPSTIYVNHEQSAKPAGTNVVTQEGIERACKNAPRASSLIYQLNGRRVVVVNGKNTDRLEVGDIIGPEKESLSVTKVERTLIDLAVRPQYAGGVGEVLEAYRAARNRVSSNVLLGTLKKLDYAYPYHQCIGYYLEQAGYDGKIVEKFRSLGLNFDFYLVSGLKNYAYRSDWRLHVPEGF